MSKYKTNLNVVYFPCPGYVYLINAIGTNYFKIGMTKESVLRRISEMQTGCPIKLRYVYHAYVEDVMQTEKELHKIFDSFRQLGEWFTLTESSIKECITLMRLMQTQEPVEDSARSIYVRLDIEKDTLDVEGIELNNESFESIAIASEIKTVFCWTVKEVNQYFPCQPPDQLFLLVLSAAHSGLTVREIIRTVLKFPEGPSHPTRSYSRHGKTLLKWLIENYDDGQISQLPRIQEFLQNNEKE